MPERPNILLVHTLDTGRNLGCYGKKVATPNADPLEFANLAASPEHAQTKAALSAKLDAWMKATDDPIRKGPVPVPEGGHTTPVGAYSPNGDPRPKN
ncbi:MAG: hypothetical protein L6R28_24735 [Planctomycetes bacterium]|nr:hypothetical protein [Planctomycetota bacterium]